jgi:hypothetical protein
MGKKEPFSLNEAKQIGEAFGIDWNEFDVEQFRMGLKKWSLSTTPETWENTLLSGKIVLAHLKEFPNYYTRLAKMEKEAETFWDKE